MARSAITVPEIQTAAGMTPRPLNVVVASTGCTDAPIINKLLPQLVSLPECSVRAVLDPGAHGADLIAASSNCLAVPNVSRTQLKSSGDVVEIEKEAFDLCQWADLLVLAPIDANNLAKMLHGDTDNLVLEILRSWNVSKKIVMVPGMSSLMWENPMTKKQLTKIKRKWNWIQVLQPLLWTFENDKKKVTCWDALDEVVDTARNQVDLINIGHGVHVTPNASSTFKTSSKKSRTVLPPELWSMIIDATSDWELAKTLHIYTNLEPPAEWQQHASPRGPTTYMEQLEWTLLTGNLSNIKKFIADNSVPRWLSRLCIKLIMRFSMTSVLSYLESNHKDLFWATFDGTFLPDKASSVFGRVEVLDYWNTSAWFLNKKYTAETLDGASRQGFIDVLGWWQKSGLTLVFTEAALEQASSAGHIAVLEWWRNISQRHHHASSPDDDTEPIRLKPGKSICYASQSGNADVVRWWVNSGIPFPHEDAVAKLASTHGHVEVLKVWHAVKGSKMIFDNQVLVGATKMGHVNVLEWWKQSGLRVEYKTCDVEEALEDGVEGPKGMEVRKWWARNGLNLGVGTSEWMKPKVL
ncbi:flavo protein [Aureobasidium pullulans]|uniref:Flavo protein n=1 Tax=Aureobasidium pullulans TaxID=5580 RepID=A0A4S9XY94_AURPU|nr:flavo protein [Aureobasidium pullulans]THY95956.1 flavo protein [Aureobasidium pullulans]THZ84061.1 flavo protein [Aureobasidium pullulans]